MQGRGFMEEDELKAKGSFQLGAEPLNCLPLSSIFDEEAPYSA
jgi:hypothetical protein